MDNYFGQRTNSNQFYLYTPFTVRIVSRRFTETQSLNILKSNGAEYEVIEVLSVMIFKEKRLMQSENY